MDWAEVGFIVTSSKVFPPEREQAYLTSLSQLTITNELLVVGGLFTPYKAGSRSRLRALDDRGYIDKTDYYYEEQRDTPSLQILPTPNTEQNHFLPPRVTLS